MKRRSILFSFIVAFAMAILLILPYTTSADDIKSLDTRRYSN